MIAGANSAWTAASGWQPIAATLLPDRLAAWLAIEPGLVRVAIDGPPCADPDSLAASLVDPLRARGRPVALVSASSFWRDASLRFEHGREDVLGYASWVDADALRREVLDAAIEHGTYLPSLRDPVSNRSTRATPIELTRSAVLLVSGPLLLGRDLPFERIIHLAVPSAARARLTPDHEAWMLPAYDDYDVSVRPESIADVVIRPDRRTPVARGLP